MRSTPSSAAPDTLALRLAATLLATAVLVAPHVAASTAMTDPSEDLHAALAGQPVEARDEDHGHLDLLALDVEESPLGFTFVLTVADLAAGLREMHSEPGRYVIPFTVADQGFELGFFRGATDPVYFQGQLRRAGGGDAIWESDSTVSDNPSGNLAQGTMTIFVDRRDLRLDDGRLPATGDVLAVGPVRAELTHDGQYAVTWNGEVSIPYQVTDLMPDAGGPIELPVRHGVPRLGDLVVSSDKPFRSSNGAATTYTFLVDAFNEGQQPLDVRLSLPRLPTGWKATVTDPVFTLAGHDVKELAVVVEVPFRHEHGVIEAFQLLASAGPDHRHGVELGVHYNDVPQPAGHHDTLWLHSQQVRRGAFGAAQEKAIGPDSWSPLWMNADAEDPADEGIPAAPMVTLVETQRHHWYAELEPRLAIGLAFTQGDGLVSLPIRSAQPVDGATLTARVVVLGAGGDHTDERPPYWGGSLLEAATGSTTGIDLSPGAKTTVEVVLGGSGARIPYQDGARLFLDVLLETPLPHAPAAAALPSLEPGGSLRLPLREYGEPPEALPAPLRQAGAGAPLVVLGPGSAAADPADDGLRESPAGGLAWVGVGLSVAVASWRRRVSRAA